MCVCVYLVGYKDSTRSQTDMTLSYGSDSCKMPETATKFMPRLLARATVLLAFSLPVSLSLYLFHFLLDNPISNQSATSATDKVITPRTGQMLR